MDRRTTEISNELFNLYCSAGSVIHNKDMNDLYKLTVLECMDSHIAEMEIEMFKIHRDNPEADHFREVQGNCRVFRKELKDLRKKVLETHDKYGNSYRLRPTPPGIMERDYKGIMRVIIHTGLPLESSKGMDPLRPLQLSKVAPKEIIGTVDKVYTDITGHFYHFSEDGAFLDWLYTRCYDGTKRSFTINTSEDKKLVLLVE